MDRTRRRRVVATLALIGVASVVAAGCTRSEPNAAPDVDVDATIRVPVGESITVPVAAHDRDGEIRELRAHGDRDVASFDRASLTVHGTTAGRYVIAVDATDDDGATTRRNVEVLVRNLAHPDLVVGAGDSIASGHGLERRDYLGRDACWRDFDESYPSDVAASLDADLALVACSGAKSTDLASATVPSDHIGALIGDAADRTQIDWIVAANPGTVVITVGANDLGFTKPEQLFDGDALITDELDRRLTGLRDTLLDAVQRIVDATDARVAITGYHNPTAADPVGIDGCRSECFRTNVATVMTALDATLLDVVGAFDSDRVVYANPAAAFVGHEASTGLPLGNLRVTTPYCASGGMPWDGDAWVNDVDCVHPTATGARAYAKAVVAALD